MYRARQNAHCKTLAHCQDHNPYRGSLNEKHLKDKTLSSVKAIYEDFKNLPKMHSGLITNLLKSVKDETANVALLDDILTQPDQTYL